MRINERTKGVLNDSMHGIMRLRWGYGSELGSDLRAVVHVARDVGMTAVRVVCTGGVSRQRSAFCVAFDVRREVT